MNVLAWDEVSEDWRSEGELRDLYVFETTEEEWQRVVDAVRTRWPSAFLADGQPAEMPAGVPQIFEMALSQALLWRIALREGLSANCHFFVREEIEFDVDPREVSSQRGLDAVCEFVRIVGQAASKAVVLTMESSPELVIASYEPSTDQIARYPPKSA